MTNQQKDGHALAFIDRELELLKEKGLFVNIRTIESAQGAWITVDGKTVLNFCSNNYLGLANHPRLCQAAIDAISSYGVGAGAVRTIAGNIFLHNKLERDLAGFKGAEAAITFQSGFNCNTAVIPALMGPNDLIVSDALNHASIIDGVRLTKSKRAVYQHNNVDDLRRVLNEAEAQGYQKILVVTDGVFSMDGDIAPLDKIVAVAQPSGAIIMVDDAHGEGVLGNGGRGIVDHFGLRGQVHLEIGTLSKALGVVGGMVTGSARLIEYLRQKSRPFLFSSATTIPDTAACIAAVELLSESTELVDRLWANTNNFKTAMLKSGFDLGNSQTPIVPVMLGKAPLAQEFSKQLFEAGIFAMALGFPTVPKDKARIRVMISATHSDEDLIQAINSFERVGRKLGVI